MTLSQPGRLVGRPWVYIASPYTKGDPAVNTRFQCEVFDRLLSSGLVIPYAPLWSHFQHVLFPRGYRDWIELDLAVIERMDACLRLGAAHEPLNYWQWESSGADGEVKRFEALGRPVFSSVQDVLAWAAKWPGSAREAGRTRA